LTIDDWEQDETSERCCSQPTLEQELTPESSTPNRQSAIRNPQSAKRQSNALPFGSRPNTCPRAPSNPQSSIVHRPSSVRWPWLVTAGVIAIQAAQICVHSVGKPGFGTDFQLLYAVATVWGHQQNPYDDAAIKEAWRAHGDPSLPEPGRPITPNVYPLTVAPLIWPLTRVPFGAAILLWTVVVLAAEAWLIMQILQGAAAGGRAIRRIPVAMAITILMLCYPVRLNLASLNIGLVAAALALAAVRNGHRPWLAGIAMGLSLIKYSVTGPLLVLMVWRRQYRAVAVAVAVQALLVSTATWGGTFHHPFEWTDAMRAEISDSLEPGGINAHDTPRGAGMHLELRSLWWRFFPGADAWHWLLVAALFGLAASALSRTRRGGARRDSRTSDLSWPRGEEVREGILAPADSCTSGRSGSPDPEAALVIAITLVAFYHRAYDLLPVMVLTLIWLVRPGPRTGSTSNRFVENLTWAVLALTIVPGLWRGWDTSAVQTWARWFVQPACAWSAILLIPLLCRIVRNHRPIAGRRTL
jgi:hypothetical protein